MSTRKKLGSVCPARKQLLMYVEPFAAMMPWYEETLPPPMGNVEFGAMSVLGTPAHQHNLYCPPGEEKAALPQEAIVPFILTLLVVPANVSLGTVVATPHVSSISKESDTDVLCPTSPSMLQVDPDTHVRCWYSGAGPRMLRVPKSMRCCAALAQNFPGGTTVVLLLESL
jgi:hypothetical protein